MQLFVRASHRLENSLANLIIITVQNEPDKRAYDLANEAMCKCTMCMILHECIHFENKTSVMVILV